MLFICSQGINDSPHTHVHTWIIPILCGHLLHEDNCLCPICARKVTERTILRHVSQGRASSIACTQRLHPGIVYSAEGSTTVVDTTARCPCILVATIPQNTLDVWHGSKQDTCGRVPRYSQFGGTRYGFEKEQRGRRPSDTAQQTATKSETRSEKLANARPLKPMAKALEFLECDGLQIARRVDDTSTSPTSHHLPSSEHK